MRAIPISISVLKANRARAAAKLIATTTTKTIILAIENCGSFTASLPWTDGIEILVCDGAKHDWLT